MLLIELFEGVGDNFVYHGTNATSASWIIDANAIEGRTAHDPKRLLVRDNGYVAGVSTTRNIKFAWQWGQEVVFVLDFNRIKQTNKVIPIDYMSDSKGGERRREESEEFVVGSLKPLTRYVKAIYISRAVYEELKEDEGHQSLINHPLLEIR